MGDEYWIRATDDLWISTCGRIRKDDDISCGQYEYLKPHYTQSGRLVVWYSRPGEEFYHIENIGVLFEQILDISPEELERLRENRPVSRRGPRARKILDVETGVVYSGARQLAKTLGRHRSWVYAHLGGRYIPIEEKRESDTMATPL